MRKVIEYAIMSDFAIGKLEKDVDAMLADGWELYGSLTVALAPDPDHDPFVRYAQAMVRYATVKRKPPTITQPPSPEPACG